MNQKLLRQIPKVDELMKQPQLQQLCTAVPVQKVTEAVRQILDDLRAGILNGSIEEMPALEDLCGLVVGTANKKAEYSLKKVINATGIILHTNLGRACISERAASAACEVAQSYSTLEYNLQAGRRGTRYSHVEELLCRLTGAESALVVNNNAAAVLLILSDMAQGGQVITSRGELVEIGGSFRVPDIMEACGAELKEVGTTNKTHLWDYDRAINEKTRALMKVHTSNYRIVGFSETPTLPELVELGHSRGLPVIEDLGSGCLVDLQQFGILGEPTVQDSVRAGVDVVSFSGDKLLGGPQAGIIVGKKAIVDKLKKHPLTRAMRVDKMTLAALEATLRSYDAGLSSEIPTIAMLSATPAYLQGKADQLCQLMLKAGIAAEVVATEGQVGGGSVPTQMLKSFAVAVQPAGVNLDQLEINLRLGSPAIVGRINHDRFLLDVRTLRENDFDAIVKAVAEAEK
ncbi:MAG: L-seryl-tRNA(Sec) selenium transferase [Oscillospiraceae bacterium]|nr:L-seryl-tRNA(Sec) selenium transferase [Oscillospiraceae bacterium]